MNASQRREEQLADVIEKHKVLVRDSHEREADLRTLLITSHRDSSARERDSSDRERDSRSERDRERGQ